MASDATTNTVTTFNWRVVPVMSNITARMTAEVMNVRTTLATPGIPVELDGGRATSQVRAPPRR
jgi:hypothetical protein